MARILVTGGGGFLGRAIVLALLDRGDDVIALDLQTPPDLIERASKTAALRTVAADICDTEAMDGVFRDYRPDAVVHCAALVGVTVSLAAPARLFRVNVEGSVSLFEAMVRHGVWRVVHISSEEIYGAFEADRIDEEHRQRPLHAYGITKAAVEHMGRSYAARGLLECVNIRTSWVYGPDFPRDRVPVSMIRAAARGEVLHVASGAGARIDHTYLDDAVAGVLGALDCPAHPFDAYHIASGSCPSLAEIAAILCDLAPGAAITVGPGPCRHGGNIEVPRKGALDCSRAQAAFGYVPRFDIARGLAAYLRHLRETGGR